jgi:hypothetical protein
MKAYNIKNSKSKNKFTLNQLKKTIESITLKTTKKLSITYPHFALKCSTPFLLNLNDKFEGQDDVTALGKTEKCLV